MNKQECRESIRSAISDIFEDLTMDGYGLPSSIVVEMIDVTTVRDKEKVCALGDVLMEWPDDPKYEAGP